MVNKQVKGRGIWKPGVWKAGRGKSLKLLAVCFLYCAAFSPLALAQGKIGIVPFNVFGPPEIQYLRDALPQMLFTRLPYDAKEVLSRDALIEALKGIENKDELVQARRIIDATDYQYLIMGAYTKMGDAFSLDVKVLKKAGANFKAIYLSMDKESKIFAAVEELSKQVSAIIGGEAKQSAANVTAPDVNDIPVVTATKYSAAAGNLRETERPFQRLKVLEIHFPPKAGICLADIDGEGKKELVTGGNNTIYVYRIDDISLNMNMFDNFNLKGYDILSVNCGDFDKDGKDEIYVTAIRSDDAVTVVLEGRADGKLQRQPDTDWYVRVANHPIEGELLLGQKMGWNSAFTGDIYRLAYSKTGGITARSPFEINAQLNLYQIQPLKYRGKKVLGFFDEGDYLKIMNEEGKVVERLKERYGGSTQAVQKGLDALMEKNYSPLYQRIIRVEDGDSDAILVLKNEGTRLFSRHKSFERGQVAYLKFDETNYKEASLSELMDGYLSDLALDRKRGRIYVTVVTDNKEGRIFIFQKGQSGG